MIYLIAFVSLTLTFGLTFIVNKYCSTKVEKIINRRVLPIILSLLFAARFVCYHCPQIEQSALSEWSLYRGPMNGFLNTVGQLAIWLEITAMILLLCRPWFGFKTIKWYTKYIASSIFFTCFIALYPMFVTMQGNDSFSVLYILLPIEIGASLAYCVYFIIRDWKIKISRHSYLEAALTPIALSFFTLQPFTPMFFFGLGKPYYTPYDLSIYHRIFLYFSLVIIPLLIYFFTRNAHIDKRKFVVVFIAIGTLTNFMCYYKYDTFLKPWDWPWHLCNIAMFIIPLVVIFNWKKLFYFTYFINVFGAVLSMLMPNYDSYLTIFNPSISLFWANHMVAYMMPLLCVALKLYDRPKIKEFFISMGWFALYYTIVLFLNPIFGAYGHSTDYFFINSNFIADKLGNWANKIFSMKASFMVNGKELVFHPLYQALYFSGYFLIGFGVWFVYQLGFDIADSHYELHLKLRGIRQDKIALKSVLNGREMTQPMEDNVGIKLELKHFSKKYGLNKHYSVHDANLEVYGGEVFGFLGPNGAGKSTIIKSIVGIQPISEGEIFVCGYNVKTQPVMSKAQIGFVPDHYALYEKLSGREYLNYIADIYEVSKEDRDARLKEYIHLFELEESIDNKIKTYSHGMKQKITIIAALVHNPKVWILDEPLTGLDPTSIFQVKECMKKHAEAGNIVFFSSHLIDIVEKLCDRIAIIKHGEIQCIKDVKEIENSEESLEQFYMKIIGDNK